MEALHSNLGELKTMAVTRPLGEGRETAEFIIEQGWEPFILHAIELKPHDPTRVLAQVESSFSSDPVDWVVFMSSSGVRLFFSVLKDRQQTSARVLGRSRIVAVGPRTRAELVKQGMDDVYIPNNYSSEGIAELLSGVNLRDSRVVLVRSSDAASELADSLQARGAKVSTIRLYYSSPPSDRASILAFLEGLRKGMFQAVLFTSAVSANNLFEMAKNTVYSSELVGSLGGCLVGAIGPVTERKLQQLGVKCRVASRSVIKEAITELIEAYEAEIRRTAT